MKSMCQEVRRNSPSVTVCSPAARCSSITPLIASSSAGRRRLPTWSARKGGSVRSDMVLSGIVYVVGCGAQISLRSQLTHHAARIAYGKVTRGQVLGDHAPGSHDGGGADGNSWTDDHPGGQPRPIANLDCRGTLDQGPALRRIQRVGRRDELHSGPDLDVVADPHGCGVQDAPPEADEC